MDQTLGSTTRVCNGTRGGARATRFHDLADGQVNGGKVAGRRHDYPFSNGNARAVRRITNPSLSRVPNARLATTLLCARNGHVAFVLGPDVHGKTRARACERNRVIVSLLCVYSCVRRVTCRCHTRGNAVVRDGLSAFRRSRPPEHSRWSDSENAPLAGTRLTRWSYRPIRRWIGRRTRNRVHHRDVYDRCGHSKTD
jgi:hypothetical protein